MGHFCIYCNLEREAFSCKVEVWNGWLGLELGFGLHFTGCASREVIPSPTPQQGTLHTESIARRRQRATPFQSLFLSTAFHYRFLSVMEEKKEFDKFEKGTALVASAYSVGAPVDARNGLVRTEDSQHW